MPRVPYQPYSDVAPSGASVTPATPPEAFGVGVARATEQFGGQVSQAGDKLFNRALAIQQLNNETEAEQANLKLMGEAGDLHAQYNALQGEERVKAFPTYKQNLLDAQARIRAGLSNDMARRMFDRPSLNTIGHSIFNGAGAAAAAQKDWVANTATSTMDIARKTIEDNPNDDILFARKKEEIRAAAEKVALAKHGAGPDSPITEDLVMNNTSAALRQRIVSVARTDPWQAGEMLEKNKIDLTGADYNAVDAAVRTQRRSIGSANIANEVYQAGRETEDQPAKTLKQMEDEARTRANQLDPKDPLLAEHAVSALRGVYNQDKYATRQEDLTNIQAVDRAIITSGAKTQQELMADPKIAAVIEALPEKDRLALPGKINRFNAARDKITNRDNYVELYGMMKGNPIKFLDQDVTKWQLSDGDMKYFARQQELIKERPQADPRVQQAIGWMRSRLGAEMRAAGVYRAPTAAEGAEAGSDWDKFTGALSVAIDQYVQETGKVPKGKEITEEIGPRVLKDVSEPYFFGLLSSEVPYFKKTLNQDEYEAFKKQRTQDATNKGETPPTEIQLERMYRQMDYIRLYGKKRNGQ